MYQNAVPVELAYRQAALCARGILSVYKDVGHMSMYENTARLICDLVKFYTSIG